MDNLINFNEYENCRIVEVNDDNYSNLRINKSDIALFCVEPNRHTKIKYKENGDYILIQTEYENLTFIK